ncbi:putative Indole-3-acetic acid-amido synthetase GH3.5 [Tripterygium wilfordii]|uniref:Putative Indole-3-acetic acid-amido synthetase GH3.5 n=1 Tax=Tripterygium wilfordii TaxID=458696 RepID=A0A7J7DI53_TRIWF|nr:indole-3-acetic acid-amido synthetase GH3.10 [Tripterygium wilfordii]KAF5745983.1 putative Indole-3-acetic acid-amido synthetase GH3.5 [Tripterygium wilfordii]
MEMMKSTKINNGSHHHDSQDVIGWFEAVSENAGQVQTQTLRWILELNWGVEYLKKWLGDSIDIQELNSSADFESLFTKLVPLVSHGDLEPHIQRIADGDTAPILSQQPITTLSLSSGTTDGRQKFVPFTSHSSQTTLEVFRLAAAYRSRMYPIREGGRILEFIYSSKQYKTKGGLTVGTATTHYYASEEFKIKQAKTKSFTCSPREVISCGDYDQSTYCHLLLGFFYSDQVEFITSTFAYSIVQAFTSFEELWKEICNDIREGTLSTRITQPSTRKAVMEIVFPNPDLASRIEEICVELEKVDWVGLIPKLWPNAKYVYSIMTGSMQPYLKKLRHYSGELPLVSADYGSTESWIGVNVDPSLPPENVTFAVVPTFSYYEFIPLYRQKQDSSTVAIDDFLEDEPVPLSQVKVGQEYEIVLTTFTGLYRCRLGDVVEVAGFHNKTPKLNFICRRKLILTVNIDKNTERDLQLVVEKGSQVLTSNARAELIDFTSHADIVNHPGHYIIYWEIKGEVEEKVLGECCREMDASFVDHGYVVSRRTNSIGPLELCIVERGTFKKILEHFVGNGAALSQFKTPRCTRNQVLLKILNLCTIKRFHSTAYS